MGDWELLIPYLFAIYLSLNFYRTAIFFYNLSRKGSTSSLYRDRQALAALGALIREADGLNCLCMLRFVCSIVLKWQFGGGGCVGGCWLPVAEEVGGGAAEDAGDLFESLDGGVASDAGVQRGLRDAHLVGQGVGGLAVGFEYAFNIHDAQF